MIRTLLALERLTFPEPEGKDGYRWGRDGAERETADLRGFSRLLTVPAGRRYSNIAIFFSIGVPLVSPLNPPIVPSLFTARWQGTTGVKGFTRTARPTALGLLLSFFAIAE